MEAQVPNIDAFVKKAVEFYNTWPGLFNWAGAATLAIVGGLCWFIWWLRGHRIEMERAGLKAQNEALKAQKATRKGVTLRSIRVTPFGASARALNRPGVVAPQRGDVEAFDPRR
jgi:hypothetical protein